MQDVTVARQDSIRLELLVGILSLAADETPPDEIVADAARMPREAVRRRQRQLTSSDVPRTGFRIRYTTHTGTQEFGDRLEWIAGLRRAARSEGADRRRGRHARKPGSTRSATSSSSATSPPFVDVPLLRNGELDGVLWFNSARPRDVGRARGLGARRRRRPARDRPRERRGPRAAGAAERDLRNRDAILDAISRCRRALSHAACPRRRDGAT